MSGNENNLVFHLGKCKVSTNQYDKYRTQYYGLHDKELRVICGVATCIKTLIVIIVIGMSFRHVHKYPNLPGHTLKRFKSF